MPITAQGEEMDKMFSAMLSSPGIWLAFAAVVVNMAARSIARGLSPKNEDKQAQITLILKSVSLLVAVVALVLTVKTFIL
jgi:hypothetical protein